MVVGSSTRQKRNKKNAKTKKKKPVNVRSKSSSKYQKVKQADNHNTNNDLPHPVNDTSSTTYAFPGGIDLYPSNHHEITLANADFHLHSICSDGKYTPKQVIEKAVQNQVKYMSLTDHDTMTGVSEAIETAKKHNVFVFPGVEISAEAHGSENIHILGYFAPGTENKALQDKLSDIRTARYRRGQEMLRKLENLGIKLDWNRVLEIAGEAAPGRPHVAEALVEAGHVPNFREAFNRYLHNDGPAYAEGEHFPPEDAIRIIEEAGGISVLAHPWCCKDPMNLIPRLAKAGLRGLEVYHDKGKIDMYGALARESSLLKTGGSDFHGIDPTNEREPGDIPFSKTAINTFLEAAKIQWETSVIKAVKEIALKCSSTMTMDLCVWIEHVDIAKRIALDHNLCVVETGIGQYRTLQFKKKSK